jgi:hypothetical protein
VLKKCNFEAYGDINPLILYVRTTSRRVVSVLGKGPHGTYFVNVEPKTGQKFCLLFWIVLKRGFYLRAGMRLNGGVSKHIVMVL